MAIPIVGCWIYRSEVQALLWHASHRSQTMLGGHLVSVPKRWWKITPDDVAAAVISRVPARRDPLSAEVMATPFAESTVESDAELREFQQRFVDFANSGKYHEEGAGIEGPATYSTIVLQTAHFPLYCIRAETTTSRPTSTVRIICSSVEEKWKYSYLGSAQSEKEALGILASLH
ncbi:MAG TPA: hypothetical protein VKB38_10380 [Terracidiphilus sp.]|nr:hypothetical protein [Terracidiphilus sp.]